MADPRLAHVFVLMLENRSFDHAFSASAAWAAFPTSIRRWATAVQMAAWLGLSADAPLSLRPDPPHEFQNVARQLHGGDGGLEDAIDMGGFALSYADAASRSSLPVDPRAVLRCMAPASVPVLRELARSYAVCDRWFSSLPGPTWPNRFFVHAATSGGLYCSPSTARTISSELLATGFDFANGTLYDRLDAAGLWWRVYHGDDLPQVQSLRGMTTRRLFTDHFEHYDQFLLDIAKPGYPYAYTFIEPAYGDTATGSIDHDFSGGDSTHPVGSIADGERLVSEVYRAIRTSPIWESSLLIITWDEHGGFFDHVVPPAAVPPGDEPRYASHNPPENPALGGLVGSPAFAFDRYGVRVPALVISPYIRAGTVHSQVLDHTSIIATVLRNYGLQPLTARDAAAQDLLPLLTLDQPRVGPLDAPVQLPPPASSEVPQAPAQPPPADAPLSPTTGSFLHLAMQTDLQLISIPDQVQLATTVPAITSSAAAQAYISQVAAKIAQHERIAGAAGLDTIQTPDRAS